MQQRHKQRLVGAVVILALAVIFLPMILRGPVEHRSLDVAVDVPPRPDPGSVTRPSPQPGEAPPAVLERIPVPDSEAAGVGDEAPTQAEPESDVEFEPTPEPEPEPETSATRATAGFSVQVGSFRSHDNAMGLRERLRDAGFPAYVEESAVDEAETVFRLRVGPVPDREEARSLAARIADEQELEGIVVPTPQ